MSTITGTASADSLVGTSGADSISGLAGNDTIDGGMGSDTMVGGQGDDLYFVDSSADRVTENANEGTVATEATPSTCQGPTSP